MWEMPWKRAPKMKKLLRSILALCLVMAFVLVPAMAAQKTNLSPEMELQEDIQPRVVNTIPFSVEGDFELYTVSESNFLYAGDTVAVSGTWGDPYKIQVRLLKEDNSRALTVNLGIYQYQTFTVPETGAYVLQVACNYDGSGTLSVSWW